MSEQDKQKAQETATSTAPPAEAAPAIEAIEEDDEFEEFEPCHWDVQDEDADDAQQWVDNWDDDDIEDEFTQQLRAELMQNSN